MVETRNKYNNTIGGQIEYLMSLSGTPTENTPPPKNTDPVYMKLGGTPPSTEVSDLIKRNKGDILADIRAKEAERDEKLQWCQDASEILKIQNEYADPLSKLWNEYREA